MWRGRVGQGIFRSAVAMDPPFATKVTVCDQNEKSGGEGARRKRGGATDTDIELQKLASHLQPRDTEHHHA